MAIVPIIIPPSQAASDMEQITSVAASTEQVTDVLRPVNLSSEAAQRVTHGTSVTLTVPLDQKHGSGPRGAERAHNFGGGQVFRGEPMRRDSLTRREALLKGKEGSRQRRRWENGMLLHG